MGLGVGTSNISQSRGSLNPIWGDQQNPLQPGYFVSTVEANEHVMSEGWVRHEVVAIIVVRRNIDDTTRCLISGILRKCAGR